MSISIYVVPGPIQSKAHAAITNSYTAIGSASTNRIRMFRLINNTDGDMFVSVDGVTNNFFVPAGSFVLYDLNANREEKANIFVLPIGTQFYIKYSTAPSKLDFYVETIHALGQ